MAKRKLDKTDIGEMYHWARCAFNSGFLKVEIDSDHAIELCERALDNNRLTEENAKLRQMLKHAVNVANDQNATYTAIEVMNIEVQQLLTELEKGNERLC